MIEAFGDLWDYPADVICITTNGDVRTDGAAVMGRGVALQAAKRYPGIEYELGRRIINGAGNHVLLIPSESLWLILAFPVKRHWYEKASPELIARSVAELRALIGDNSNLTYVLPRPGCGNGQLAWADVRPLLLGLPDNVHVITDEMEQKG